MKTTPFFFAAFLLTACSAFAQTAIQDTDGNTKVQTEASANEDKIRLSTGGTERLVIGNNPSNFTMLGFPNNGENIFLGDLAGSVNTSSGTKNVFVGFNAGAANVSGANNTFVGHKAGASNTSLRNAFFGTASGMANTSGSSNSFFGENSGVANTTGGSNTFVGQSSGSATTTGSENVYIGIFAGSNNTTGSSNVAVGRSAGNSGSSHSNCTFLGRNAVGSPNGLTNATALGNGAVVNASNKIRFGNSAVTVIEGQVAYTVSDGRFKSNLRSDAPGLDFVLSLQPVTYNFEYANFSRFLGETSVDQAVLAEKQQQREMGFIAQDLERTCLEQGVEVANLVHSPEGPADNYAIAYGQLVVPLVKAVQEQQVQIEAQQAQIAAQQAQIDELKKLLQPRAADAPAAERSAATRTACVFPNPAADVLNIRLDGVFGKNETMQLVLADAAGRVVLRQNLPAADSTALPLPASLPAGSYALTVLTDGGELLFSGLVAVQ